MGSWLEKADYTIESDHNTEVESMYFPSGQIWKIKIWFRSFVVKQVIIFSFFEVKFFPGCQVRFASYIGDVITLWTIIPILYFVSSISKVQFACFWRFYGFEMTLKVTDHKDGSFGFLKAKGRPLIPRPSVNITRRRQCTSARKGPKCAQISRIYNV